MTALPPSLLEHAPRYTAEEAAAIYREHWHASALGAMGHQLTSERDQNFLLDGLGVAQPRSVVLKIANALEDRSMLEAQQSAMVHLRRAGIACPEIVPARDGRTLVELSASNGRRHLAWTVTYLDGVPLTRLGTPAEALLEGFGARIAAISAALRTFDHPAIHRDFYWDLAQASRTIAVHRPLLDGAEGDALGETIDLLLGRVERHTVPLLATLRRAAVHNDLNDANVLVEPGSSLSGEPWRVGGILDFGDMVHSYALSDLAVAAAYQSLAFDDPLVPVMALLRGHAAVTPLGETELRALFGMIVLRLCTSASVAAHQRQERPDNAYLSVSQSAISRVLPAIARIPFGLAEATFRHACGLEPAPNGAAVSGWLAAHSGTFSPVLKPDPRGDRALVLDLSAGGALIDGDERQNDAAHLQGRIDAAMHEAGASIAIGRYDEARLIYTAPAFGAGVGDAGERRTVHIGLDLFAPAGSHVFAPLTGTVHSFACNDRPQDYGAVIVLRHDERDGVPFFTLYGHLSRASLDGLRVGARVERGARLATLGTPAENGGWPPHLHLQILTDDLELGPDFPGVARASRRAVWRSLCPDPNLIVRIPADRFPAPEPPLDAARIARDRSVGRAVRLSYDEPVRAVRGWRQFLYDSDGRRYLDGYNNVPHVGHSHPHVVRAVREQMGVLNTNTRYLNDRLSEYAVRLTATLPAPLRLAYLVNSASEANELALRIIRAHTGRRDMIVLEGAYHGNTTTLIDLSPFKHAGPGGGGSPQWVHAAQAPDDYRGPFKRDDPEAGAKYAGDVARIIARLDTEGRRLAGFIAESCPSVGGQIMLPPGYLEAVYRHVRAAGGLCVADEVQTGLGRIGTHFWAFESQGVVPDLVVMGKPLGNGHPLAAVVTSPAIAEAFDRGMEYFSTFGGNNVSCAAGLAVLEVLRDEDLQSRAARTGEFLKVRMRDLQTRFPMIGDVRGSGLFLGVELVRDRDLLLPAGEEASYIVNRLREDAVLIGTDGPHHNVLKIRPPMPFDEDDAAHLVSALERILGRYSQRRTLLSRMSNSERLERLEG